MARPIAVDPSAAPRSLRARKIAAFSTATAAAPDAAASPRLRWTVDQRCLALGVVLTEERRTLAKIFDETDTPMTAGEVWSRARALGLKASRSHVYLLAKHLLAQGVLIITEAGRTIRYAVPMAVRITVRARDGHPALDIVDPIAIEALVASLLKGGRRIEGHDIAVDLVDRPEMSERLD